MIVATAGHIDHGKTALVKALTGVETDRLPEEKKRGLSIDLGFAYLHSPEGSSLGFVDVPGHERFIRNMLAGVCGVDFALLVVAADDGPMPQTAEHLAILDLLGLTRGAVAINKCDRVPAARIEEVATRVRALLDGTCLADAPVFPVSALSGDGVQALLDHLWRAAGASSRPASDGGFRLAVDRAFALAGSGLVVTGTVFAGRVRVGDRLVLSPAGVEVRIRAIHAQNRPAASAQAGERCSLNLVGADLRRAGVRRGDWILAPKLHAPTDRIDIRLRVSPDAGRSVRDWSQVHVHLGAAEVGARVAVLEGREIAPGGGALVQLALDRPIGAMFGDRLIVRDASAQRTLGGGTVVDPWAPKRNRRRPERRNALLAMEQRDGVRALSALLESAPDGVDIDSFTRGRNLSDDAWAQVRAHVPFVPVSISGQMRAMAPRRWQELRDAIERKLAEHHGSEPQSPGLPLSTARAAGASPRWSDAAVAALVKEGKVTRSGNTIALAGRSSSLHPDDSLWERLAPLIGATPPPTVSELSAKIGLDGDELARFLARMARKGAVVALSKNRYCDAGAIADFGRLAEAIAQAQGGKITAAAFRDRAGIGRNLAIEVLEYFDRAGFTRRVGDAHQVVRTVASVFRRAPDRADAR